MDELGKYIVAVTYPNGSLSSVSIQDSIEEAESKARDNATGNFVVYIGRLTCKYDQYGSSVLCVKRDGELVCEHDRLNQDG